MDYFSSSKSVPFKTGKSASKILPTFLLTTQKKHSIFHMVVLATMETVQSPVMDGFGETSPSVYVHIQGPTFIGKTNDKMCWTNSIRDEQLQRWKLVRILLICDAYWLTLHVFPAAFTCFPFFLFILKGIYSDK